MAVKRERGRAGRSEPDAPPDRTRRAFLFALTALCVARPLVLSDAVAYRGDGVLFVMLWLLLAAAWLLRRATQGRPPVRYEATDLALLALLVWHSFSAVLAAGQESPRPAINMLWEWLAMGVGFFMVRQLVTTATEARALMYAMIALAVALSAIGCFQSFYSMQRDRARYEQIKDDPHKMMELVGEWYPPNSPERTLFESRLRANEPSATFALTNSLAGYIVPWLVVALGLGALVPPGVERPGARWLHTAALAVPCAGCLLLTKSRSAILAACIGVALLTPLLCRRGGRPLRRLAAVVVAGLLALLVAAISLGSLDKYVLTEAGKSLGYRYQYWQSTWAMIADRPFLGCGPGQFRDFYTRYKLPEASEEIQDPHNFLLEVWATAGTPAVAALVVALGLFARGIRRPPTDGQDAGNGAAARQEDGAAGAISAGAIVGPVLAWLVAPLTGLPIDGTTWLIAATTLGLALLVRHHGLPDQAQPHAHDMARLAALGVLVLLVNLLAAGGIGYPGVAGTLWMLMALGLGGASPAGRPRQPTVAKVAIWSGPILGIALLGACYLTAYRPALESRSWILRANSAAGLTDARLRETCLQRALVADPFSAEAAQLLAAHHFRQWQETRSPKSLERLQAAALTAVRLAPRSSSSWNQTGQWWSAVYHETGTRDWLSAALHAHRKAVECYPNSAALRARYAIALERAGQTQAAAEQARASLRLDAIARQAGHSDKCLPQELRDRANRVRKRGRKRGQEPKVRSTRRAVPAFGS